MTQDRSPVMIIEDDDAIRRLISQILQEAGHPVVECECAEDALHLLSRSRVKPSVITLDLAMPSMDGTQFLGLLRGRKETAHIPVVVVTAAPELFRTQLASPDALVSKPFHIDSLLRSVERAGGFGFAQQRG